MKLKNIDEFKNKQYLVKPREVFEDACKLICYQLEDYGFKYLKRQNKIKKREKGFIYSIYFQSSHYNHLNDAGPYLGSVAFEFSCSIHYKKQNF